MADRNISTGLSKVSVISQRPSGCQVLPSEASGIILNLLPSRPDFNTLRLCARLKSGVCVAWCTIAGYTKAALTCLNVARHMLMTGHISAMKPAPHDAKFWEFPNLFVLIQELHEQRREWVLIRTQSVSRQISKWAGHIVCTACDGICRLTCCFDPGGRRGVEDEF